MGRSKAASPTPTPGSGSSGIARAKTVPTSCGSVARGRGRCGKRLRVAPPARVGTPALRRLARRGGVKRIAADCYDSARDALRAWLHAILHDVCILVEHRRRHTACLSDVMLALKRNGCTLYGWSDAADRGRSYRVARLAAPVPSPAASPGPAAFTRGGTSPDGVRMLVQRALSSYFDRQRTDECTVAELARLSAAAAAAKGLPPPPRAELDAALDTMVDQNRLMLSEDRATIYLL